MRKKNKEELLACLNKELDRLNCYDEKFIDRCKEFIGDLIKEIEVDGKYKIDKKNLIKKNVDYLMELVNICSLLLSICCLLAIPSFGIIRSLFIFTILSIFEIVNNNFIVKRNKSVKYKFHFLDNLAFKDYINYISRMLERKVDDKVEIESNEIKCDFANDKHDFIENYYINDYEREFMNKSCLDDYGFYLDDVKKKVK